MNVLIGAGTNHSITRPAFSYRRHSPRLSLTAIYIILLRSQIALGGLDREVPEQKLDLLQIPAILPAQLGAGATEVVGAEALEPDLFR